MPKHKKKYHLKMVRELSVLWDKDSRTVIKYLDEKNLISSHPESKKVMKKYSFTLT